MLFCYSVRAAGENWLHDGLVMLLTRAFQGQPDRLVDHWLEAFPEGKRNELRRKTSFLRAIEGVVNASLQLNDAQRTGLLSCLDSQNRIPEVFDPATNLPEWPTGCGNFIALIENLFDVAFKLLTPIGVRDRQYELIYEELPARVCPFCGIEPLTAPDPAIPRESLDHYLPASKYPFAGANLRNLAPAGTKCNSSHKQAIDVLRDQHGARRRCFDPFGGVTASVSLLNSRPLEGPRKRLFVLPDWDIQLVGDADAVVTWDAIYDIKTRYRLNVLDAELRNWLDHFATWSARDANPPTNRDELLAIIDRYQKVVIQEGFADFLKREVFRMLAHQCREGPSGDRVTAWLISLLSPSTGAVL